jgi:hypothetical protein
VKRFLRPARSPNSSRKNVLNVHRGTIAQSCGTILQSERTRSYKQEIFVKRFIRPLVGSVAQDVLDKLLRDMEDAEVVKDAEGEAAASPQPVG